jgi:hypothetical protein
MELAFLVLSARSWELSVAHLILQLIPKVLDGRKIRRRGRPVEAWNHSRIKVAFTDYGRVDRAVILLKDSAVVGLDPRYHFTD